MRLHAVKWDLLTLVLMIPVVMGLFRVIDDRALASLYAGALFVLGPAALMIARWRRPLPAPMAHLIWWNGVLLFWVAFALPILGMRLAHWGEPFAELQWLGVPATVWHRTANIFYILMMGSVAVSGWLAAGRPPTRK